MDAALKVLHVQILADLSGLREDEFWDKMKRNKCTYLTKHGQDPLSPVRPPHARTPPTTHGTRLTRPRRRNRTCCRPMWGS